MTVNGSLRLLTLFDVAESIHLERVRATLAVPKQRAPVRSAPEYVRFENPPVIEPLPAAGDEAQLTAQARYYDYGVIAIEFLLPFETDWPGLVRLAADWLDSADVDRLAGEALQACLARHAGALVKVNPEVLLEDYTTVHVLAQPGQSAAALIEQHGAEIAQIIRGERQALSADEQAEILQSRLSYYPSDAVIAGWSAAFIYDTPEGADTALPLIEYANSQLLEYRYYDGVLTATLAQAYDRVQAAAGFMERLRLGKQADRLNAIVLEVRELTERTDTGIKFLSDMFSARLYRLVAARVGVPDYRRLVDGKLATATELYHYMLEQRNHRRAIFLEATVVIILIIDLIYLFRGK